MDRTTTKLCSGTGALVAPRRGSKAALQAPSGRGSALQPQGISCARSRAPRAAGGQLCFRQDGAFDHAAGLSREDAQPAAQVQRIHRVHEGREVDVAALALHLHGHAQDSWGRPLWRRLACAPEAMGGRAQWPVSPAGECQAAQSHQGRACGRAGAPHRATSPRLRRQSRSTAARTRGWSA